MQRNGKEKESSTCARRDNRATFSESNSFPHSFSPTTETLAIYIPSSNFFPFSFVCHSVKIPGMAESCHIVSRKLCTQHGGEKRLREEENGCEEACIKLVKMSKVV